MDETFRKHERLSLRNDIDALFHWGKGFIVYPVRAVYRILPEEESTTPGVCLLVSAGKKYFKRANKRNRVKRLFRETYRLNKSILRDPALARKCRIHLALMTVSSEMPDYKTVQSSVCRILGRIAKTLDT